MEVPVPVRTPTPDLRPPTTDHSSCAFVPQLRPRGKLLLGNVSDMVSYGKSLS